MKSKTRNKVDEWGLKTTGRQGRYEKLEREPVPDKVLWHAKRPVYGIEHPNAEGELNDYGDD